MQKTLLLHRFVNSITNTIKNTNKSGNHSEIINGELMNISKDKTKITVINIISDKMVNIKLEGCVQITEYKYFGCMRYINEIY